jgi:predicted NAD/FAD-binding protein
MAHRDRRSFLKAGSAALVGASLGRSPLLASTRPRVGIIGGGLAGVSCAWLLDGVADAVLFESRSSLGGHAHTIPVDVQGEEIQVDVGAQFFGRGPQPTYVKLVELLGLSSETIEAEMTITLSELGAPSPRFVSPAKGRNWTLLPRWNRRSLWAFLVLALAAKRFTRKGDWLVPVDAWLGRLPVPREDREDVLLPLLSAMIGCTIEQTRGLSARGALVFIGKALPDRLLDPFRYANSAIGLGGNVARLAAESGNLESHLASPADAVRPLPGGGYRIRNQAGVCEDVDILVFATPPYATRPLVEGLPGLAPLSAVLAELDYFPSEISIHRDPIYMPADRRFWSAYNPLRDGDRSEASVWYGALRPVPQGGTPLALFKSWATERRTAPASEIFRRAFAHPLVTPGFIEAQGRLAALQGRERVWLAGSYTTEVDSQESALLSSVAVVRRLAPDAPNLLALDGAAAGEASLHRTI